ncbi:MAG TPA: galactokinase [Albitalea sp.]|nr:galactokinase [Albitalea sp.]
MNGFDKAFGHAPSVVGHAPGRVNLLGEHTDYNDGFVLPIAIPQRTWVAVGTATRPGITLVAQSLGERVQFALDAPPEAQFARYVYGCLHVLAAAGHALPAGLNIHVSSDVPIGVGLSSSAALAVATLRALRQLLALDIDDVQLARLAQHAEIEHASVRCGIMDQMAASLAGTTRALFLDTRSLATRLVDLPAQSEVLVLDSGIARALAASGYNQRRAECEEACRLLDVPMLRDVPDALAVEALPEPLRRRARHVVSENARVLRAVEPIAAEDFGALMNDSHASLRDDYEVSTPQLDRLVELLQSQPAVHGARLTGAGFGGACVALCEQGAVNDVGLSVLRDYERSGGRGSMLVPTALTVEPG